jgi:hypothetical protein
MPDSSQRSAGQPLGRTGRAARVCVALLALAPSATAVDRFEVQVYDGHTNAPGLASLENHVSFIGRGTRSAEPPVLPTHHQLHWTLEGALGVTRVWEPGIYFQTALLADGTVAYAGTKLRSKFTAAPLELPGAELRFAVNVEAAAVPERFEHDRWSVEVRPVAALDVGPLRLAVNPIFGVPVAKDGAADGPSFEPATSLKAALSGHAALGLEYYGSLGPVGALEPASGQQHYLYGVGDYALGKGLDLNIGAGGGLAGDSDAFVVKAILGIELGRLWGARN